MDIIDELSDVGWGVVKAWMHRVVAAISCEIGQVLDVQVLSKSCPECEKRASMNHFSDECLDLWAVHQSKCNRNYHGSSPMMEVEGALRMFHCSEYKNKLCYTNVLIIVLYESGSLLGDGKVPLC